MKSDLRLFWKYVAPSVFGAVIGGSFAIVDAIFIGLAGGENALAATAVTWPLVMFLQAFGFLVGQVMRELKGKADPRVVNALLRRKLAE